MDRAVITRRIREESEKGMITCARALQLAGEMKVAPREIGRAANEIGVKIGACQLGCFP